MSYPPGPPPPQQPGQPSYGPGRPVYGPGQQGFPPGFAPIPPTNNKATAALITGITTLVLSWCCGLGVFGLVAVALGLKGRAEVRRSEGAQTGDGLALAGIVTGAIATVVGLAVIVLIILVVVSGKTDFTTYEG